MHRTNKSDTVQTQMTKTEFISGGALQALTRAAAGEVHIIEEDGTPLCVVVSADHYRTLLELIPNETLIRRAKSAVVQKPEDMPDVQCKTVPARLTEEDIEDVLREID